MATSSEHVPPKSWFPLEHRNGLITVPSCSKHNTDLHLHQEYVRAIITTEQLTNETARQWSAEKVIRSITRTESMYRSLMKTAEPVIGFDGKLTALIHTNLERFNLVMRMISYGLYFYLNSRVYTGGFEIYSPNFTTSGVPPEALTKARDRLFNIFSKAKFEHVNLENEEVLKLEIFVKNTLEFVYKLTFFGGFTVLVISVPPWRKFLPK